MPIALISLMRCRAFSAESIMMDSVISISMRSGEISWYLSTCLISFMKLFFIKCLTDTLTLIMTSFSVSFETLARNSTASSNTRMSILSTRPVFSAMGMKSAGLIMEPSSSFIRARASKPLRLWLMSYWGWRWKKILSLLNAERILRSISRDLSVFRTSGVNLMTLLPLPVFLTACRAASEKR